MELRFIYHCSNTRCSEYKTPKIGSNFCDVCCVPMVGHLTTKKEYDLISIKQNQKNQKPMHETAELSEFEVPVYEGEQAPAPFNDDEQPEEKAYEIDLEGFDITKTIKESITEYVAGKGEIVDQHLKDMVAEAVKSLKPTIIKMNGQQTIKIEGRLHKAFEKCLFLCTQERQLFVAGAAGSGKTTLAGQIAKAMQLPFAHISCSAGLSEAHLLGRMLFDGTYVGSDLVRLYEEGGVFLFDEIDAADANTLLTINSALANGVLSVPNRKEKNHAVRHKDFICICAGNTWGNGSFEYHGRNHLDAAFMDRFALSKVLVDYDVELEREICGDKLELFKTMQEIRASVTKQRIRRVVSTRAFISGTRQLMAGSKMKDILDTFFIGWSEEEIKKATNKTKPNNDCSNDMAF